MKYVLILFVIIAAALLFAAGKVPNSKESTAVEDVLVTIKAEVADTDAERIQGLSGREGLPENIGLLFVFPEKDYHGIWMKDMLFPIDILWLVRDGEEYRVVGLEEDVSPETFPAIFRPQEPADYVLETAAGFAKEQKIKIGTFLKIETVEGE